MTPGLRSVPADVAELAVEHVRLRGDFELLQSEVRQAISTLTTLVHDVQAEQMRAREERTAQTVLLQSLAEKSSGFARMDGRHDESRTKLTQLELELSHWRGVFKGALLVGGAAAAIAVAYLVYRLDTLDNRVQRIEVSQHAEIAR